MERIDDLLYWIKERYIIQQKKRDGTAPPWSDDPVFQTTYFCNVHREDDKVTMGIRNLWNTSNQGCSPDVNMMMARMVNNVQSLMELGWPWKSWQGDRFEQKMSNMGVWGNAYIVSTNGRESCKHKYIGGLLSQAFQQKELTAGATTLAEAHKALMAVQGLGTFMSGQIIADLKHTKGHVLTEAPDWWTWCAHGPGSLRGMAWVLGYEDVGLRNKCTPTEFYKNFPALQKVVDTAAKSYAIPRIGAQDLQNCLCEFDKYMRVLTGTGRSRRNYAGT